jgi:hypothetical protein
VQIIWDGGGIELAGEQTFFYGKRNANHELGRDSFVYMRIISAVERTEFVSDRVSYIIVKGLWCRIIVLNVRAPTENRIDDVKNIFYEELEHVFDQFRKYHMKILLGDFNAEVGREDILKLEIGNESLHEISSDMDLKQ